MRGINYSKMLTDGDMTDSKNISARAYPYITNRKPRAEIEEYEGVTAVTVFRGKIVAVKDTDLIYDGVKVGTVSKGEKQFAAINTKLVIMPDKVYLDGVTGELHPMEAMLQLKDAVVTEDSITVSGAKKVYARGYGGTITDGKLTVPRRELEYIGRLAYHQAEALVDGVWCERYIGLYTAPTFYPIGVTYGQESDGGYPNTKYRTYITVKGGMKDFSVGDGIRVEWGAPGTGLLQTFGLQIAEISGDTAYSNWVALSSGTVFDSPLYNVYVSKAIRIKEKFASGDPISIVVDGKETVTKVRYGESGTVFLEDDLNINVSRTLYDAEIAKLGWSDDFTKLFTVGDEITVDSITANVLAVSENELTLDTAETREFAYNKNVRIWKAIGDVGERFRAGDAVFFDDFNFVISKIEGNVIYADGDVFEEGTRETAILERRIPDLDYICESDNRIWGCSKADNTIYASALGDPTNFYDYSGESTDSYAVGVGSEEAFTACHRYGDSVLFFKENKIHKVLGSYPAEYRLYSYDVDGVQEGCHKSLKIIGEVLYYKGVRGVFAYNGSPQLISDNFGEKMFNNAVAGGDSDTYYISMTDGERYYLFAYETRFNMWILEDDIRVLDFANVGGLYMLCEGGKFFRVGAEGSEADIDWMIQFAPLYETIQGQKAYSRMVFRVEMPAKSNMIIEVRPDDGAWREAGQIVGKNGIVPVAMPINRCDKFEIRLKGKGNFTIHSILREYAVGGEK
jgi:hypothetical protein